MEVAQAICDTQEGGAGTTTIMDTGSLQVITAWEQQMTRWLVQVSESDAKKWESVCGRRPKGRTTTAAVRRSPMVACPFPEAFGHTAQASVQTDQSR
jgi:hypothetical protein